MPKLIEHVIKNDNFTLSRETITYKDYPTKSPIVQYWLWDNDAEINISMRAVSVEAALIEAYIYWSKKAIEYESIIQSQQAKLDTIAALFQTDEDDGDY